MMLSSSQVRYCTLKNLLKVPHDMRTQPVVKTA